MRPRVGEANGRVVRAARNCRTMSPRVRIAARMYATGATPTKTAAAKAVGLNPYWFTMMTNHNEETRRVIGELDEHIQDRAVDMTAVLQALGRKAVKKIHDLMQGSGDEQIALRAAVDLADRSPETAKVQKIQDVTPHITPDDAKLLAATLVEAAEVKAKYLNQVQGDFVRITDGEAVHGKEVGGSEQVRGEETSDAEVQGPRGEGQEDEVHE